MKKIHHSQYKNLVKIVYPHNSMFNVVLIINYSAIRLPKLMTSNVRNYIQNACTYCESHIVKFYLTKHSDSILK